MSYCEVEEGGTAVMLDVGGCGLPSTWRTEAAGRFLRCGPGFCAFIGSSSESVGCGFLHSPNVSYR